jgi:uncharacterized RDD family membrane protein YckC
MSDNNQINPFAPPGAAVSDVAGEGPQLATRGARFGAAFIDGLVAMAIGFAVLWPMYGKGYFAMAAQGISTILPGLLVYMAIFYAIEGFFLYTRSQSLGKMALGLRIVRTDGSWASVGRTLGVRLVGFGLLGFVPVVGPFIGLIDVLFIFGSSRRCLHDRAADTIVVEAASSPIPAAVAAAQA